ncbi:MAG: cupin domain-containing protein [Muribaculaceae bacterium]|nr:cupin domain-containing protein [Muribaculaceae bacterium]
MDSKIEKKKVFVPGDAVAYSDGGIVSKEFVHSKAGSITLFSFDAGQRLSEHSAPFDATLQILDGEAEIMIDGELFHPKAGQMLIIPANARHSVNAVHRFKMMLTMIRG